MKSVKMSASICKNYEWRNSRHHVDPGDRTGLVEGGSVDENLSIIQSNPGTAPFRYSLHSPPSGLSVVLLPSESQPAGNASLGLGRLPRDSLVELVDLLFQFLAAVLIRRLGVLDGVVLQMVELGTGLVHFSRDYFIRLPDFPTYTVDLRVLSVLIYSNC